MYRNRVTQYLVCPRGHTHTNLHARDCYCTLGECRGMIEGEATRITVKYTLKETRTNGCATSYIYVNSDKETPPLPKFYWYLPLSILLVILLLKVARCSP